MEGSATSYNGQTITYDEIGNPISYRGNELEWDGRQLISYTNADDTISFTYSSEGYRSSKSVNNNTTNYTYLDGKLIEEDGENGKLCYTYDEKGNLSKISHITSTSSNEYYIACNSRGDVEAIYDTDGALVAIYIYDAWGNTTVVDSNGSPITSNTHIANINPIRYRGYYYDSETGLYYVLSRYYDPEVGRWINADSYVSTGQGVLGYNMFAYCGNNPVNRVDSTGRFWKELCDAFVQTIQQTSGYFAVAAGVSQFETPALGPADVVSGVLLLGGVLACAGIATYTAITAQLLLYQYQRLKKKQKQYL